VTNPTPWIKASKSASNNDCVELRRNGGQIELRDSKNPDGAVLSFTPSQIEAWLDGARQREFDGLL